MPASTILVNYRDGSVAPGKKIDMSINGAFCTSTFTDSSGRAVITHSSTGLAKVYISGQCVAQFRAPGTAAATVP